MNRDNIDNAAPTLRGRIEAFEKAIEGSRRELEEMIAQPRDLTNAIARKRREIAELEEDLSVERDAVEVRERFFDAVEKAAREEPRR